MKDRNKGTIFDKLYHMCISVVVVIFALISIYLFFLSMFSTAYVSSTANQFHEYTYFVKDKPMIHLGVIAGICLTVALLSHCYGEKQKRFIEKKGLFIVPFFFWLLLVVWVFVSQMEPGSDQYCIFDCAARLADGDYSVFAPGGYLERYPFQTFLVLIVYCFQFVFGKHHYLAFQCFNALFLSGIYLLYRKISEEMYHEKLIGEITYLAIALFFPLFFYVGFCYGSIPGLFFGLLGLMYGIRYLNTSEIRYGVLSAFILAVCPYMKNSCLIFMIAYVLILVVACFRKRKVTPLVVAAGMIVGYFLLGLLIQAIVFLWTGQTLSKGYPLIGQIAMGFQNNEMLANGWFNSYTVDVYEQVGHDYHAAREIYLQEVRARVLDFWYNKGTAVRFFVEKIASQWNNPTFQSLWYYNVREAMIERSPWVESVINGTGARVLCTIANYLQSFFLFGNLSYLVYRWKKIKLDELLLQVCFLGGFFLHLLVEAKSQYVLMFYILILPMVVKGLEEFIADFRQLIFEKKVSRKMIIFVVSVIVMILVIRFTPGKVFDVLFRLEKDAHLLASRT